MKGNNLDMQLAVLETQLGLPPSIPWISKNAKLMHKYRHGGERVVVEQELLRLRKVKLEQKLYWIRKELGRAVKKARGFAAQRLIKKLKACTADDKKRAGLERDLTVLKGIDYQSEAERLFEQRIVLGGGDYLSCKLTNFGIIGSTIQSDESLLTGTKSLETAITTLIADLEAFLRRLVHEHHVRDDDKHQDVPRVMHGPAQQRERIDGRNRMGQRARRQQWEKLYGQEARHLQGTRNSPVEKTRASRPPSTSSSSSSARSDQQSTLHPSWEAKQRIKAKEQNVMFQGNRVKFADPDDE